MVMSNSCLVLKISLWDFGSLEKEATSCLECEGGGVTRSSSYFCIHT